MSYPASSPVDPVETGFRQAQSETPPTTSPVDPSPSPVEPVETGSRQARSETPPTTSPVEPAEIRPEVLLQLDGVSMHYGKGETAITALAGVDLAVREGELVAIMGASGSGKSTLLTIAGGLTTPTSGEVVVQGRWLSTMSPAGIAALRRRTLGFVFQDFNLIPALTALENVTLPLELDGWRRRKARSAGLDALRSVELDDRADRYPDDLSGGQQQRVAIARAVVGTRRLILADEPTGALDSTTGEVVLRMLRRRVDAGAGGILVTHDARHAAWADRIVFLRDGRVVDESDGGSVEQLLMPGVMP